MFFFLIFLCGLTLIFAIQTPDARIIYETPEILEKIVPELDSLKDVIELTSRKMNGIVTITISNHKSKISDMENSVIKYLSNENLTVQLLGEPPHIEFESSEKCRISTKTCRRHFVLKETTNFYVIIIEKLTQLERKLYSVYNSTSYNASAEFLIYYTGKTENSSEFAQIFRKYLIFKVIFITKSQTYILQLKLNGPGECLEKSRFSTPISHKSKQFAPRFRTLIRERIPKTFKNCTIPTIGMRYEPFVIDEFDGFEIKLLKMLSEYLNVTFNINITGKSEDWGDKINGSWGGNFAEIYKSLKIGVGNVGPEADRIEDFDFTFSHYSATLVWVVPVAKLVEKWRVLTVIFPRNIWIFILIILITIALTFSILSRFNNDNLKSLIRSFLASFQIQINSSVHRTPQSNPLRIIFSTSLIFALVITCLYSSALIKVFTDVVREHQIETVDEIIDSDLIIGGLEEYNERFRNPIENNCVDELCKRYRFNSDENDTAQFWLEIVENGEGCTPLPRLFTQFYMIKTYENAELNGVREGYRISLFIINNPINFYPLGIVMKKGNPFKKYFDRFVLSFLGSGLVYPLTIDYYERYKKLRFLIENPSNEPEKLTVYHLQGIFALVVIGGLIAVFVFVIEVLCGKFGGKREVDRVLVKKFYYDERYGDLYGKNFPSKLQKKFM